MARPSWLKCETCLFFKKFNGSLEITPDTYASTTRCYKSPRSVPVAADDFCASWTCRRCLQPWATTVWEKVSWPYGTSFERGSESRKIIDHNKCKERES